MFADDAKLLNRITQVADCKTLAEDLAALEHWSDRWLLLFNPSKCKVMRLGKNNPPFDYKIGLPDSRLTP